MSSKDLLLRSINRGEDWKESEATILLNSLPDTYKDVKIALKYGRDTISTDLVTAAIKCKELEFKLENKASGSGETLFSKEKICHFKKIKFIKGQRFHKQKSAFKRYK